ncbi:hypothetical protein EYF80_047517 [Liparis tanakae]|uniref:Uncharacterized protein n=1 Tax=Liparis tanakae TaxID=230148 RepID=A0A4Z2FND9_9TELE|nr:hypothetical protein EYF80_047517 [Liparis tanakae]
MEKRPPLTLSASQPLTLSPSHPLTRSPARTALPSGRKEGEPIRQDADVPGMEHERRVGTALTTADARITRKMF